MYRVQSTHEHLGNRHIVLTEHNAIGQVFEITSGFERNAIGLAVSLHSRLVGVRRGQVVLHFAGADFVLRCFERGTKGRWRIEAFKLLAKIRIIACDRIAPVSLHHRLMAVVKIICALIFFQHFDPGLILTGHGVVPVAV